MTTVDEVRDPSGLSAHVRRYGEPDWSTRPTTRIINQGLFGGTAPGEDYFPPFTDESYEEWKVRHYKGK